MTLYSPSFHPGSSTPPPAGGNAALAFPRRINQLKADLIDQAHRVQAMIEAAFDAAFSRDPAAAARVIILDEVIDRVDVDLERASVKLLTDATASAASLAPDDLRMVLTIVKVNNELERIADAGVAIAETVKHLAAMDTHLPDTLRIITNSVVGILRDAAISLERNDPQLAKVVLASEDAIEEFKKAILRDTQVAVSQQRISVDLAFLMHGVSTLCEVMAGHCTNIAEQALYVATGKIVRHMGGHWEEAPLSS